ncbi:sensor domain-containing protein [Nocardiopsis sp. CT-R113]|uniref:histidine kinase n=1 Tax=Nocardiopsis codii TaxID=3065942 RepID=A0ABU7KEL5_9ACTN|nr:sensor domain-containing protein [Nocardiopsis sp. CT-R113]MEE2040675.1 sensor domain-containing protein [Nocardiopsis sp. CT-R113]
MTTPRTTKAPPRTLLTALPNPRFLLTAWPWRALAHSANTMFVGLAVAVVALPVYLPWAMVGGMLVSRPWEALSTVPMVVGFVGGLLMIAVFAPLIALPLGALERRRLPMITRGPFPSGHRVPEPGLWAWVRTRFTEGATWREIGYLVLLPPVALLTSMVLGSLLSAATVFATGPLLAAEAGGGRVALGFVTITSSAQAVPYMLLAPVCLVLLLYAAALLSQVHAVIARALLVGAAKDELRAELNQVTESRARLVNAFEYERRRIERDLHDGAQQRLVALSVDLGLARLDLEEGGDADRRVAAAQDNANELIDELRELVRGIHPRVLTDRGLTAALEELADRCPVPTRVDAGNPVRLPAHVEGTAYFVVAEALTNVAKHAGAAAAVVRASTSPGASGQPHTLRVEVTDDGDGGAEPANGSGLTGLEDRVAVMGGTMELSSPVGGPTRIRVELPCGPIPPTPLT